MTLGTSSRSQAPAWECVSSGLCPVLVGGGASPQAFPGRSLGTRSEYGDIFLQDVAAPRGTRRHHIPQCRLPDVSSTVMQTERRLHIPGNIPEDFAQAVATVLLLGIAGGDTWDTIYRHPPETSLAWIGDILNANDTAGLVHTDLDWWEHQLRGH